MTAQRPDRIIYKGKEYVLLLDKPLELYFELNPLAKPTFNDWSSACSRGYIARFEIKNKELRLKDIFSPTGSPTKTRLSEEKIYWYTGCLTLDCKPTVKNHIVLEIEKGKVIKEHDLARKQYQSKPLIVQSEYDEIMMRYSRKKREAQEILDKYFMKQKGWDKKPVVYLDYLSDEPVKKKQKKST